MYLILVPSWRRYFKYDDNRVWWQTGAGVVPRDGPHTKWIFAACERYLYSCSLLYLVWLINDLIYLSGCFVNPLSKGVIQFNSILCWAFVFRLMSADPSSVRLSVNKSVRPSVIESVSGSVNKSVRPSVGQSVRPSVSPPVSPSVSQSISQSVLFVSQSVTPSVCHSVCQSVRPSVSQAVRESIHSSIHRSECNFSRSQYKVIYYRSLNFVANYIYSVLFCRKISKGDFTRSSLSNLEFGYFVKSKSFLCHACTFSILCLA